MKKQNLNSQPQPHQTNNTEPKPYIYIRAWCMLLGSNHSWAQNQITKATTENAPQNAIYFGDDNRWHTLDEITRPDIKAHVEEIASALRGPTP